MTEPEYHDIGESPYYCVHSRLSVAEDGTKTWRCSWHGEHFEPACIVRRPCTAALVRKCHCFSHIPVMAIHDDMFGEETFE